MLFCVLMFGKLLLPIFLCAAGAPKPTSVELGGWSTTIATCDEVAQEQRVSRSEGACVEQDP